MDLRLERKQYRSGSTVGRLFVDDVFECFTLEDGIRTNKVYGETAIPAGRYRVVIDHSEHFGKDLPHVLDVPGFQGIRIHPGNAPKDTLGCILVGRGWTKGAESITDSRVAFAPLYAKLRAALDRGEDASLQVLQEEAPPELASRAPRNAAGKKRSTTQRRTAPRKRAAQPRRKTGTKRPAKRKAARTPTASRSKVRQRRSANKPATKAKRKP